MSALPLFINPRLFAVVGSPTLHSYQRAREWEHHCRGIADPHSFHLTLDVRSRPLPSIKWTCNTDLHFGITRMSLADFRSLIHPAWLPIYREFCGAAYRLVSEKMPDLRHADVTYTVKVPLRQMDGSYWWYNQVSRPCEFDITGRMVAHFNNYYRLAPYAKLTPDQPIITVRDRSHPVFERQLQRAGSRALSDLLLNGLRPREFEVLYLYRRHLADHPHGTPPPTNDELASKLGVKVHGVNKYNTRILTTARPAFPAARFASVAELAGFLNALFGEPVR